MLRQVLDAEGGCDLTVKNKDDQKQMPFDSKNARNTKTCPFCKELINRAAVRCPQCHADLKTPKAIKKKPFYLGNFMLGIYVATIFWIFIIIYYIWNY